MYTVNNLALIGELRAAGGVWLMSLQLQAHILAGAPWGGTKTPRRRAAAAGDITQIVDYHTSNNNEIVYLFR